MNVLFISQYFPPETGAAPERAFEFVSNLKVLGYHITVITGMPNHPLGVKHKNYYGRIVMRDSFEGIDLIRTYVYANPIKSVIIRLINFFSFTLSSLFALFFIRKKYDVIILTLPPLFLGFSGIIFKFFLRIPLIVDIRDIWPEAAIELGLIKENTITKYFVKIGKYIYSKADKIIVVTEGVRKNIINKGISSNKVELITNGVNTNVFLKNSDSNNPYLNYEIEKKFIVVYAGTIGMPHGTTFIVDAAKMLEKISDILFVFIGDGVKKNEMEQSIKRNKLQNIIFIPNQQITNLVDYLSHSHVGLATLKNLNFCNGMIPVKIFSYMACELPIILCGNGESTEIIKASNSGICIEPENVQQLADTILELYHNRDLCKLYGKRGRDYVELNYSREFLTKKLENILRVLVLK